MPAASSVAAPFAGLLAATPFYRWLIGRRPPQALVAAPADPWPGEAAEADLIFQGRWRFAGEEVRAPNLPPWHPRDVSAAFRHELDGMAWLRHFQAAGGEAAQRHAQALVGSWIAHHPLPAGAPFAPATTARRVISLIGHYNYLAGAGDAAFAAALLRTIARDARHLRWTGGRAAGPAAITVGVALVLAGVALPEGAALRRAGESRLARALEAQILPDGTHLSRNPEMHLVLLRDLVVAREALTGTAHEVPDGLRNAIDRIAPVLRFFRHGDGALALFNGGREAGAGEVELTLTRADAAGKAPASLPHGGFERLSAKRMLAIVDTGQAPMGMPAHAAPLAFELSIGRRRVLVNCGAAGHESGEWPRVLRGTAAHSTVTVDDAPALELDAEGRIRRSVPVVALERNEASGSVWLEARHEGYRRRFGLIHHRRIFVDGTGEDFRGEDRLTGAEGAGRRFAIRFHLHPQVHVQRTADGRAALLRVDDAGFRFRASGAELTLEESVYLGRTGQPRRSEQIVLSGRTEGEETVVKWALRREG